MSAPLPQPIVAALRLLCVGPCPSASFHGLVADELLRLGFAEVVDLPTAESDMPSPHLTLNADGRAAYIWHDI